MACSMRSRTFLVTVTSDDTTVDDGEDPDQTTSSKTGLFVPFTEFLPFSEFTGIRVSVEVLSRTPNLVMEVGGRTSNDGSTIVESHGFAEELHNENLTSTGWTDYRFVDFFEDEKFFQLGIFSRLTDGSSVPGTPGQMGVVRVVVDFKAGLTTHGNAP